MNAPEVTAPEQLTAPAWRLCAQQRRAGTRHQVETSGAAEWRPPALRAHTWPLPEGESLAVTPSQPVVSHCSRPPAECAGICRNRSRNGTLLTHFYSRQGTDGARTRAREAPVDPRRL